MHVMSMVCRSFCMPNRNLPDCLSVCKSVGLSKKNVGSSLVTAIFGIEGKEV